MMFKEIYEAKEIFKEEALKKIEELIKSHELSEFDILSIFDRNLETKQYNHDAAPAKSFDPFFDAW